MSFSGLKSCAELNRIRTLLKRQ